jgi:hypothetical protein
VKFEKRLLQAQTYSTYELVEFLDALDALVDLTEYTYVYDIKKVNDRSYKLINERRFREVLRFSLQH